MRRLQHKHEGFYVTAESLELLFLAFVEVSGVQVIGCSVDARSSGGSVTLLIYKGVSQTTVPFTKKVTPHKNTSKLL